MTPGTSAEIQSSLDVIHNALGTIDAANRSPHLDDVQRFAVIREAVERAQTALREVDHRG